MRIILSMIIFGFAFSCDSQNSNQSSTSESVLFKVAIMYPNGEGKSFDMAYYQSNHMPMVASFLGENLMHYEIDQGISGRTASDEATYVAIGYFYVQDIAKYNEAIGQNRDSVINDIKNYTNIQPIIQISKVKHIGRSTAK